MAEETAAKGPLPIVPYLKIPEGGDPGLGSACGIHRFEKA